MMYYFPTLTAVVWVCVYRCRLADNYFKLNLVCTDKFSLISGSITKLNLVCINSIYNIVVVRQAILS